MTDPAAVTAYLVILYGLAGAVTLGLLAYRLYRLHPGPGNGDRLRWPVVAALAWAHLTAAVLWSVLPHLSVEVGRQVSRAGIVAALAPVTLLTLRLVGRYLRRSRP